MEDHETMNQTDPIANLQRMQVLASYDLFSAELATDLQAICRRTADRLHVAVAAVQVVLDTATAVLATNGGDNDFLAQLGGSPNEMSFCPTVVITRVPYIVDDLTHHPVHRHNPGVQAGLVRAYAGVPLTLPNGVIIGSHCVMDPQARHFTYQHITELVTAAIDITNHITGHRLTAS